MNDILLDLKLAQRQAENLLAKGNDMTAEDLTAAKSFLAQAEELKGKLALEQGKAEATKAIGDLNNYVGQVGVGGAGVPMKAATATEGNVTASAMEAIKSQDYRKAYEQYIKTGDRNIKVMQEGLDEGGGFLVPEDILQEIVAKKPAPTSLYNYVSKSTTARDMVVRTRLTYATDDIYTTGMRVTWTGEVPATSTTHRVTEPTWGQIRIPIFTAMMSMPITRNEIEDAWVDVVSYVGGLFGQTIDLLRENMIVNGTGVGQPAGILQNPNATDEPATVNSGAAAALTADGLINLDYAIPPQYEGNFRWVMNKNSSLLAVRKLKDGEGRYLWASGSQDDKLANGPNATLLGYPISKCQFMPNVSAGTYPIIGGDLTGYEWVDRVGLSIQVLQEVGAQDNQVILLARYRCGGDVLKPWQMKIQYVSA